MDLAHVLSKTDSSQLRLRVYLNCVGVVDALEFEARKPLVDLQHKDIRDLGRLILSMATGTEITSASDNGAYCVRGGLIEDVSCCTNWLKSFLILTMVAWTGPLF